MIAQITPFPVDDNWFEEQDPTLRYYKYLASQVDWDEWPGGAAEIVSAYEGRGERLDQVTKERDEFHAKLEAICPHPATAEATGIGPYCTDCGSDDFRPVGERIRIPVTTPKDAVNDWGLQDLKSSKARVVKLEEALIKLLAYSHDPFTKSLIVNTLQPGDR